MPRPFDIACLQTRPMPEFASALEEALPMAEAAARAIENTCYIVSARAIGAIEGGGQSYGHSLVVAPWGEVIADGGEISGAMQARIDLDRVAETAGRIPSLQHDRDHAPLAREQRNAA